MLEGEFENQDVTNENFEESSISKTNESEGDNQSTPGQGNQPGEGNSNDNVPFHNHPRFRELIEQNNQFKTKSQEYEQRFSQMQAQLAEMNKARDAAKKQEDALHARLKGIDPEFGERFAKVDSSLQELNELKQWRQQMEMQQVRQQAEHQIGQMHNEHKVSKEMQELYNAQIRAIAQGNPNLGLKDLPNIYKQVHEYISKTVESIRRSDRMSYVQDKKKDSLIPGSAKGKAPSTGKSKFEYSKDPGEARQQLVKNILNNMRSE